MQRDILRDDGKVYIARTLKQKKRLCMIGDGMTDAQVRIDGVADQFYAFTENIRREAVCEMADVIAGSFHEVIAAEVSVIKKRALT